MKDDVGYDRKPRRFALLLAARDSDYVKKIYGGYFNVFVSAFGEEGESWDLFRVVEGEFPEADDLDKYDGFVVSGSPYAAYGNEPWIVKLCFLLQTLDSMAKKLLGICFGHQVLCRALGGKVGKAESGWDLGIRKIEIANDILIKNELIDLDEIENEIEMPWSISIIECHQDEILELPIGANVIAYSDKTGVEMFSIDNHILGIQGHPEYTKDILYDIIDRLLLNGSIETSFSEKAKIQAQNAEPDRQCWEKICRKFLKTTSLATFPGHL